MLEGKVLSATPIEPISYESYEPYVRHTSSDRNCDRFHPTRSSMCRTLCCTAKEKKFPASL